MNSYGIEAIVRFVSHLVFIYLAFWSLQSLQIKTIFKKNHEQQIKVLFLMVAIFLGYICSSFLLELMSLVKNYIIGIL